MADVDIAATLLRAVLGATLIAHGWNHAWGTGGIAGTASWFEGVGLRPGPVHAWASVVVELAAGTALLLGLATPLAAAAGIGVMAVAGVTVHRRHGFFVFREGYEYVLTLGVALAATAMLGPGRASLDHAFGLELNGIAVGAGAAGVGLVGCTLLLAVCWRPVSVRD